MKIANISVQRPVAITMAILIIVVLGLTMLTRLPVDLFPDMDMPVVTVTTKYFGASPKDIETQVTDILEEEFSSLDNLDTISSTSQQDVSTIMIQFKWGTDLDIAAIDVKDAIAKVKHRLPSDLVDDPIVEKMDPTAVPILQYSLIGEASMGELYNVAENQIKPQLEKIKGVSKVDIVGGVENEVKVYLDPIKMKHYGLSVPAVLETISKDSRNYALGKVDEGDKELSIRAKGEINEISELEKLTFLTPTGGRVYLKDFARVEIDFIESSEQVYFNGKKAIGIFVYKQKDANTVELSSLLSEEVTNMKDQLSNHTEIITIIDSADFIKASIKNLVKDGLIGALLAVSILYLFLGRISSTLVVSLAIPISIIMTFTLMYLSGITINLITLGALGLGIGLMVDDAVVVMQNIFRHYHQEGRNIIDAAKIGTQEVGSAVIAATITKVIVFLPMMFVEGLASQIFQPLAITVTFALLASLVVSLTVTPMLSSVLLKEKNSNSRFSKTTAFLEKAAAYVHQYIQSLEKGYLRLLKWSLKNRAKVVTIAIITLLLGIGFVPLVGGEFMPKMDSGEFTIEIEMPNGTQVENTNQIVEGVMDKLEEVPELDMYFVTMGTSKNSNIQIDLPDYAIIDVMLVDLAERNKSTASVVDELRAELKHIPGVDIKLQEKGFIVSSLFSSDPIFISVKGNDQQELKRITDELAQIVEDVHGTREVKSSFDQGQPEVQLDFNRDKLKTYGLDIFSISKTVRTAIKGEVVSVYRSNNDEMDIRVIYEPDARKSLSDLEKIYVFSPVTGEQIPLEALTEVNQTIGPNNIYHEDRVRMAYVTAAIFERDLNSVNGDISKKMDNLDLPTGYTIEFGGESEDMEESFSDLGFAFILAVILIYMVMAAEFESLKHPFVIMFTLPLTFFGVTASLALTGRSLSVPALLGIIMLVGIVVSNAIVLIEYTNQLRKKGRSADEALLEAGPTRLHPILMTTLTTVIGLIPLALGIGEGAETHAPMATVVVGGLSVATLLTLIVIPVLYSIFDGKKQRIDLENGNDIGVISDGK